MVKPLCGNSSAVERCLAKAEVGSSNLLSRSRSKVQQSLGRSNSWEVGKYAGMAELADARDLKSFEG